MALSGSIMGKAYSNKKFRLNIHLLKEGMMFDNYKDLCLFLDIPVQTGNSKEATINELRRYCELIKHETGKAYYVGVVYDEPQSLTEMESYRILIRDLLCDTLVTYFKKEGSTVYFTTFLDLVETLNFVNPNYKRNCYNAESLRKILEIPEEIADLFFRETTKILRSNINYALEWMKKRNLIYYAKIWMVKTIDEEGIESENFREADDWEISGILKARDIALKQLKRETLNIVVLTGEWEEFSNIVKDYLLTEMNITTHKEYYKIIFSDLIEKSVERLSIFQLPKERYIMLNDRFLKLIEATAERNLDKYQKGVAPSDYFYPPEWFIFMKYMDTYLYSRKLIQDYTIKIKGE